MGVVMSEQPGILALWNDYETAVEEEYERWYMRQHLPERIGVPGFRFGRRYVRLAGDRKYFTFYETDSPDVLWSPEYMRRLEHPTNWTQRVMEGFHNTIRTVCRKEASVGTAMGCYAITFRSLGPSGLEAASIDVLAGRLVPELSARDGVCHTHFWVAAKEQTPPKTAETDIRGTDDMLSWAVIIEVNFEEDAHQIADDGELLACLQKFSSGTELNIGIYRFACMMTR